MKIGIIRDTLVKGRGDHGLHLAFPGIPGAEIMALADSNTEGIADRLALTGAQKHYLDWREMMEKEPLDIVVLVSRLPGDHLEPIRLAAKHRIHVLCEKPLTADLVEADEMVALARESGIKIAVAHLARYSRIFRTMKQMITDGAIGRPLTFYGRGKEDERGGGEDMMVLGTHILDIAGFLFGAPERVYAEVYQEGRPLSPGDRLPTSEPVGPVAGDDIFACFRFADGLRGIFESRKGLYDKRQTRMGVTVAGTAGCLAMRYNEGERCLRLTRSPFPPEDEAAYEVVPLLEDPVIPGAGPLPTASYLAYFLTNNRLAAWDLMQAIREDREPVSSAADARLALEMIVGIYASQFAGGAIPIPVPCRKHPLEN